MATSEFGPCVPGDKSAVVPAVGSVFISVGTVLLALRMYVRLRVIHGGYGWDDTTMALAWVFCIVSWGLSLAQIPYGFGKHAGCSTPERISKELELQYTAEVPLIISTLFSRISICIFLLRLFSVNRAWKWSLWLIGFLTTITNIASATIILIQCTPRAKLWNPTVPGSCWAPHVQVDIGNYQGAMSAFLDICLSLLPIYILSHLQLSNRLKIGICGLMSLGLLTAACVTARTIYLGGIKGADVTWDAVNVIVWANLEAQIAIIVGSLPTIRPIFTKRSHSSTTKQAGRQRLGSNEALKPPQSYDRHGFGTSTTQTHADRTAATQDSLDSLPPDAHGTLATATARSPEEGDIALAELACAGGIGKRIDVEVSR